MIVTRKDIYKECMRRYVPVGDGLKQMSAFFDGCLWAIGQLTISEATNETDRGQNPMEWSK